MLAVLRLNMQVPGLDPNRLSLAYQAALDMAQYVDANGFTAVTTDEHHGADNGWMPSTLTFTGMLRNLGYEGVMLSLPPRISLSFVARDPDKAWAELGHHFLHEATTYAAWQTPDIRSGVHSHATTVAELRAEGIYEILTPEACRARAEEQDDARFVLHPLCGGLPPDQAWECVELFTQEVLGR